VDARRLRSLLMIAVFDVGGPLVAYALLRKAGFSTVSALVLSGVFPAAGVTIKIIQHRRADAVGILVLAGIAVGTILGLVSHNPKLVLDEGSVPTLVFGLVCLGSLGTPKPLMYRLSLEFIGPETRQGREFTNLWQYEQFRRIFKVITIVWGVSYLVEAAARVIIVQKTTPGTALAISRVMPYAVAGVLFAWTLGYGRYQKYRGERQAAAAAASADAAAGAGADATAAASADAAAGAGARADAADTDESAHAHAAADAAGIETAEESRSDADESARADAAEPSRSDTEESERADEAEPPHADANVARADAHDVPSGSQPAPPILPAQHPRPERP
jgi:hypothetical protein